VAVTQTDKKKIIERLIKIPKTQKRLFWGREIKSLNVLLGQYPSDEFWKKISFSSRLDSMIVFRSGYYAEQLKNKFNRFNYKVNPQEKITIGKKVGEDYKPKPTPKTLKDFLS
jgi:hypothetical protein